MEKNKYKVQTAAVVMLCLRGASHLYFIEYIELKPGLLSGAPMKQRVQAELGRKRERRSISAMAEGRLQLTAVSWLHHQ